MSWIAEYDTQGREFPTCVHVTKTTGTMTHGATYVPIEDGKAVRAENEKLQDENERLRSCLSDSAENSKQIMHEAHMHAEENAKLRELVRDMKAVIWAYDEYTSDDDCPPALPLFKDRLRELGIEVDE